ncbi:MAG: hypothetical protein ACTS9Y_00635 [Methylophilus sp.]|uniref:hypothetical protein n=1 Tax=Methylophilus sp. TaxID=29541 RepID=UPI003F9EDF30
MDIVNSFIESIGIKVIKVESLQNGFMDDIEIVNGSIYITTNTQVSNLLHEAGHLAIIPANLRHMANGDLDESFDGIFKMTSHLDPEHPIQKVLIQCSDPEATAWAWAIGQHLGIPDDQIIRDEDYDGEGKSIRWMLKCGKYFGIHGLAASGMTSVGSYPNMVIWSQPACAF